MFRKEQLSLWCTVRPTVTSTFQTRKFVMFQVQIPAAASSWHLTQLFNTTPCVSVCVSFAQWTSLRNVEVSNRSQEKVLCVYAKPPARSLNVPETSSSFLLMKLGLSVVCPRNNWGHEAHEICTFRPSFCLIKPQVEGNQLFGHITWYFGRIIVLW